MQGTLLQKEQEIAQLTAQVHELYKTLHEEGNSTVELHRLQAELAANGEAFQRARTTLESEVHELRVQLALTDQDRDRLRAEASQWKAQAENAEQQLAGVRLQNDELIRINGQTALDIEKQRNLEPRLAELEIERMRLQEQLAAKDLALEHSYQEKELLRQQGEAALQVHRTAADGYAEQNRLIQTEIQNLRQELAQSRETHQREMTNREAKLKEADHRSHQLEAEVITLRLETSRLEQALEEASTSLTKQAEKRSALEARLHETEEQTAKLAGMAEAREGELTRRIREIDTLNQELKEVRDKCRSLEDQMSTSAQRIAQLEIALEKSKELEVALKEQGTGQRFRESELVAEKEKQYQQVIGDNSRLQEMVQASLKNLQEEHDTRSQLEVHAVELKKQHEIFIERHYSEIQKLSENISAAEVRNAALTAELERERQLSSKTHTEVLHKNEELLELKALKSRLDEQLAGSESKLRSSELRIVELETKLAATEEGWRSIEKDRTALRADLQSLQTEHTRLQSMYAAATSAIAASQEELQQYRLTTDDLRAALAALTTESQLVKQSTTATLEERSRAEGLLSHIGSLQGQLQQVAQDASRTMRMTEDIHSGATKIEALAMAHQQIAHLQGELEATRGHADALGLQLEALRNLLHDSEAARYQKELLAESSLKRQSELEADVSLLREEASAMRKARAEDLASRENMSRSWVDKVEKVREEASHWRELAEKLQRDLLTSKQQNTRSEVADSALREAEVRSQLDRDKASLLQDRLAQTTSQVAGVQSANSDLQQKATRLEQELQKEKSENTRLQNALQSALKEGGRLQLQLAQLQTEARSPRGSPRANESEELHELRETLIFKNEAIRQFSAEVSAKDEEILRLSGLLDGERELSATRQEQLAQLGSDLATLHNRFAESERLRKYWESRCAQLEEVLRQQGSQRDAATAALYQERLQTELELREELTQTQSELEALTTRFRSLQESCVSREDYSSLLNEYQLLHGEYQAVGQRLDELQLAYDSMKAEYEQWIEDLRQKGIKVQASSRATESTSAQQKKEFPHFGIECADGVKFGQKFGKQDYGEIKVVQVSGPAKQAGIQQLDIIKSVDGHTVSSLQEWKQIISRVQPGQVVEFGVERSGQLLRIPVQSVATERKPGAARYQNVVHATYSASSTGFTVESVEQRKATQPQP
eukprot:TRINITY_DN9438_c0_g1_i1.p1 TRINITY_DN9438_c0_g1~~TRINITY_DN9438_c0_g1_i1.p1  ORF type:complete len:1185 (+),score=258.68 TRINITY_DN9438_c0_g1_i1:1006-4560(+)